MRGLPGRTRRESFLEVELAELLDVLLMLSAAPVMFGNSGGLRDFVVEISRWVLGQPPQ